eukprot:TRINITY_DN13886_c1_g1_i1.p1 TRINITY_DN13886_c1_g1~~TRINITY_DN13886_c1_g1_i1.p1  ORF type:complete len:189 (+),score=27.94 TRINITY_DN13886_c1_g1_i1:53-619(+)
MSDSSVVIKYVVPAFGAVLGVILYSSPLPELYRIHKRQSLGAFNPTPFALQVINATGWCTYSFYLPTPSNAFIFVPNWYGIVAAILVLGGTFPLATKQAQMKMIAVLLYVVAVFYLLFFVLHIAVEDIVLKQNIIGTIAVVMQVAYFGSPLETMFYVIKNKDARSIYWPFVGFDSNHSCILVCLWCGD